MEVRENHIKASGTQVNSFSHIIANPTRRRKSFVADPETFKKSHVTQNMNNDEDLGFSQEQMVKIALKNYEFFRRNLSRS